MENREDNVIYFKGEPLDDVIKRSSRGELEELVRFCAGEVTRANKRMWDRIEMDQAFREFEAKTK